jgi:hypothetical protein
MKQVMKQLVLLTYLAICLAPTSAQVKKEEYWEPIEPYRIKITRVRRETSRGVIIRDVNDNGKERFFDYDLQSRAPKEKHFLAVRVGTKITTSPISDF